MSHSAGLVLLTGASRGVGRAAALSLAARGQSLLLSARDGQQLEHVAALCRAAGAPEVHTLILDLNDVETIAARAAESLTRFGTPTVLIHNAGIVERAPIDELSLASWQAQLTVNLSAPFALTRALLPAMRARGSGRILFVGSISSTLGTAKHSAYAASKWGVVGFMKCLAEELRDSGLMTAALLPGSIDTDMLAGSGFPPRMTAEEVAHSLTYLALDAPLAHNGATIEMFGV